MRTRFSQEAGADLRDIVREIAADNPPAARRVRDAITRAATRLMDNPEIGRLVGPGSLRRIVVAPYLVFYQVQTNVVTIVRVLHGARDVGTLLSDGEPTERRP